MYVAIRLDFHKESMECTEHTLITASNRIYFDHHTKHSTGLKQKRFDIQSLSPTLRNLYY